MNEQAQTPPTPTTPPPGNSPEARTADGTLIDQGQAPDANSQSNDPPVDPAKGPNGENQPSGAPEAYAAFTVPEGQTLDPATLESATPIFRELGLDQAAA